MSTDISKSVRALVERGANINETDGIFKGTPLSAVAAHGEHPQMLDTLTELGVHPHAVDTDSRLALDLTREFDNDVVAAEIERVIR